LVLAQFADIEQEYIFSPGETQVARSLYVRAGSSIPKNEFFY